MKKFFAGLAVIALMASSVFAAKVMPLEEVKTGMKGCGKTVYHGVYPQKFDIEILGIAYYWTNATESPVIIAEMKGGPKGYRAEETGAAEGMSGSPCYLNGKLIGSLAYGGYFDKRPVMGIQPAEITFETTANGARAPGLKKLKIAGLRPLKPLLCVPDLSGLEGDEFKQLFENERFTVGVAGKYISQDYKEDELKIEPGSAINVYLTEGDVQLYAHGTVLEVRADTVWAFGHPFTGKGQTSIGFRQAEVIHTQSNYLSSYKMPGGAVGKAFGTIIYDGFAGIKGILGKETEMIPFKIALVGRMGEKEVNCSIIRSSDWTFSLLKTLVLWSIIDGYNLVEPNDAFEQSATIETEIRLKDLPSVNLSHAYNFREGNSQEVAMAYYLNLKYVCDLLLEKRDEISLEDIEGFSFKVTYGTKIEPFKIKDAEITPDFASLGDTLEVSLKLLLENEASRKKEKTWYETTVQFTVPENAYVKDTTRITVEIANGASISSMDLEYLETADELIRYLNMQSNKKLFLKTEFVVKEKKNSQDSLGVETNKSDASNREGFILKKFGGNMGDWKEVKEPIVKEKQYFYLEIPLPNPGSFVTGYELLRFKLIKPVSPEEKEGKKASATESEKEEDTETQSEVNPAPEEEPDGNESGNGSQEIGHAPSAHN